MSRPEDAEEDKKKKQTKLAAWVKKQFPIEELAKLLNGE